MLQRSSNPRHLRHQTYRHKNRVNLCRVKTAISWPGSSAAQALANRVRHTSHHTEKLQRSQSSKMCRVCQAVQSLTLLCDADGATPHSYPQSVDSCVNQVLGLSCSNHCSGQGETEMRLSTKEKNWQNMLWHNPLCRMQSLLMKAVVKFHHN